MGPVGRSVRRCAPHLRIRYAPITRTKTPPEDAGRGFCRSCLAHMPCAAPGPIFQALRSIDHLNDRATAPVDHTSSGRSR